MSYKQNDILHAEKGPETARQHCFADSVWFSLLISGIIGAITFATFSGVLDADFVAWDDNWCIYDNPTIGGLSFENLRLIFAIEVVYHV